MLIPPGLTMNRTCTGVVEAAIRVGGLADIKAARIRDILNTLVAERGTCSLEHLHELADADVKAQLIRCAVRCAHHCSAAAHGIGSGKLTSCSRAYFNTTRGMRAGDAKSAVCPVQAPLRDKGRGAPGSTVSGQRRWRAS